MASSYFLSDHTPKPPQIRSSEPSTRTTLANGTFPDSPFPGFHTPINDPPRPLSTVNPTADNSRIAGYGSYGGAGNTGGKVRSSRRCKKTPYERPATGRHATPGGSASLVSATPSSSIASRLRDSASRLIASSASYLFPSLFKRRPLTITSSGESHKVGVEEDQRRGDVREISANGHERGGKREDSGVSEKETKELDIAQVEEVLKQRTWSREQVSRLTEVLQSRLTDNTSVRSTVTGLPEQPKGDIEKSTPVQVARAYMEDQGARPLGIATLFQSPVLTQSSAHRRTFENGSTSPPLIGVHNSRTGRNLKRSFALDNDLPSTGSVRRVRQKTSILPVSPYLYSKQITGATASTSMVKSASRPPMKSSQTALRILQTLDKLSPSPKLRTAADKSRSDHSLVKKAFSPKEDKILIESRTAAIDSLDGKDLLEPSRAPEEGSLKSPSVKAFKSPDHNSTDKIGPGSPNLEAFLDNIVHVEPSAPNSEAPVVKSKGFRMSAVFEESTSDEEYKLEVKPVSNIKEAATSKPPLTTTSSPAGKVHAHELKNSPVSDRSSMSRIKSESIPIKLSPPNQSVPSTTVEKLPSGATPFSIFSFATGEVKETGSMTLKPSSIAVVSNSTAASSTHTTESEQLISAERVSIPSFTALTSSAVSDSKVSFTSTISDSKTSVMSEQTFPSQLTFTVATEPVMFDTANVSTSAPQTPFLKIGDKTDEVAETDNGIMMATESPTIEKFSEVDTMATDCMTEETGASVAPSSSVFPLSVSSSSNISLGAGMASSSAFSFTATSQSSSSSASMFAFGDSFNSSGGQASMNGTSSSSLQVSQSSSSSSSLFLFNSSASATTGHFSSDTTGLTSSSPAAFQFAISSASASSSGPFNANSSESGFLSQPPSTGSAAAPAFSFGSGGTSVSAGQPLLFGATQSSTSTNSSFPISNSTSNPFATTGASGSASSFQFASGVASVSSSPFSLGSTSPGTLSFPSTSAAPSIMSFGSSAPATSSSQSTFSLSSSTPSAFSFGSNGNTSPAFGSNAFSGPSSTPAFASNGAPSSSSAFMFGSNQTSNPLSSSSFAFNSTQPAAPPAFGLSQQPIFGSSQQSGTPTFGSVQPTVTPTFGTAAMPTFGSAQPASTPVFGSAPVAGPTFGLTQTTGVNSFGSSQPPSAPFTFGGQNNVPSSSGQPFAFGAQPVMPAANPFTAPAVPQPSSDFAGGFAVGASGGEKSGRKFIKAKRTGTAKRK